MRKYTLLGPKVDNKIQEHMDLIVRQIKKDLPGVLSIMLAGSFGQGEGAAKIINGEVFPFNDYDIYIITKKSLNKKEIEEISDKISKRINYSPLTTYNFVKKDRDFKNTFYLDLKFFSLKDLEKVLPRLRNYSMKKATTILYGKDYRYLIPDYKVIDIPLSDPAKILLDRMNQLAEYYSVKDKLDQDIISYKIQAAYSACATALLMLNKKFDSSYVKSMENLNKIYKKEFPKLYKKKPSLPLRIKTYIEWKINPKEPPFKDMKKELFTTIEDILEVAKYFFSRFLNKDIFTEDDLSFVFLTMGKNFYKPYIKKKFKIKQSFIAESLFPFLDLFLRYKYFLKLKERSGKYYFRIFFNKYSPDSYISAATPFLISYILNEDKNILGKLISLLKKVYPIKNKDWENISLDYRKAYLSFFLQNFG